MVDPEIDLPIPTPQEVLEKVDKNRTMALAKLRKELIENITNPPADETDTSDINIWPNPGVSIDLWDELWRQTVPELRAKGWFCRKIKSRMLTTPEGPTVTVQRWAISGSPFPKPWWKRILMLDKP